VIGYLNDLNKALVGRNTCYLQTALGKLLAECVVVFPAVTVTLVNKLFAVYFAALGILCQLAGVQTKTHCAALFGNILLVFHDINNGIGSFAKLCGVCSCQSQNIS